VKTATEGMILVSGGEFRMGSGDFYPEERPIHEVVVGDLWVDDYPVTNAQFRRFVKASCHVTVAERAPDAADFPCAATADLVPGSLVFVGSKRPIPLDDWTRWWASVPGTNWRRTSCVKVASWPTHGTVGSHVGTFGSTALTGHGR
jgi:formylglycine-generating enzyme